MPREGLQTLFTDDDRHGLAYLKDYRVGQVTTHGHDRPIPALLPSWKEFAGRRCTHIPQGSNVTFLGLHKLPRVRLRWSACGIVFFTL
jgi:hypothetical protein